jgi:lipopolysaccharide transport system ATP-binding protein
MQSAISLNNIGKSYILAHQQSRNHKYAKLSDAIINLAKSVITTDLRERESTKEVFWALEDISFNVGFGERVGIIGRNGAGKSTLLKVISRITSPTKGSMSISGRVASLLEVGTGFHPELTGRENIFLNGAVLGMTKNDIRRQFDQIVDFSEVEKFLDTPVKHYSSGMYMRLAFSVAAHLEPDILIVDEVLAVGDATFQKKCLGKMREVGSEGRTVLFVSHNMGAITEFCNRAILLDQGHIAVDGTPQDVIPIYSGNTTDSDRSGIYHFPNTTGKSCTIQRVMLRNSAGESTNIFDLSDSIAIEIQYTALSNLAELQLTVTVIKDGIELFHGFDNDEHSEIMPTEPGIYVAVYQLPSKLLKEGVYSLRITAGLPTELLEDIDRGVTFEIVNHTESTYKKSYRYDRAGLIISPGKWSKNLTD